MASGNGPVNDERANRVFDRQGTLKAREEAGVFLLRFVSADCPTTDKQRIDTGDSFDRHTRLSHYTECQAKHEDSHSPI